MTDEEINNGLRKFNCFLEKKFKKLYYIISVLVQLKTFFFEGLFFLVQIVCIVYASFRIY